jgi:hypothetical protein
LILWRYPILLTLSGRYLIQGRQLTILRNLSPIRLRRLIVNVSLRNIMAASGVALQVFQIAAICKRVSNSPKGNNSQRQLVNGLSYIHEKPRLYHGTLDFDTVLLNQDGKVKIGRFKNSFTIV